MTYPALLEGFPTEPSAKTCPHDNTCDALSLRHTIHRTQVTRDGCWVLSRCMTYPALLEGFPTEPSAKTCPHDRYYDALSLPPFTNISDCILKSTPIASMILRSGAFGLVCGSY
jgi:hypothetical protein